MQRSATTGSLPYVDHEMYHRKVQRMQRNIDTQQSKVLDCRQKIEALKKQQGNVRNAKHTSNKLGTWRLLYDIQKRPEGILRAPDRRFPTRLYSRMDNDVWTMAELRGPPWREAGPGEWSCRDPACDQPEFGCKI